MRGYAGKGWHTLAAVVALAAMAACGGGEQAGGAGDSGEAEAGQQGPVVPDDSVAWIQGTVDFEGTAPEAEAIDMSAEAFCAGMYGEEGPMTQEVLVQDGKLKNVFVYLKSGVERDFPTPSQPVELDQQGCRYHPHVLGVQAGQTLAIMNSDSVLHNINAKPSTNRGFNISQPQAGMTSSRSFSLQEVMIPVECDVHGWMSAYLGVLEHPFYSVSKADGSFSLTRVPAGEYTVEAWHEEYGTMTRTVSVAPGDTAQVNFTYSADMAGADVPLAEPIDLHDHAAAADGDR